MKTGARGRLRRERPGPASPANGPPSRRSRQCWRESSSHRRRDDWRPRFAARHSNRSCDHTRAGGACSSAVVFAASSCRAPRYGENERSVELLSPHAEAAAGFRHRDSNVRRNGGYFCGSVRDKRQRDHDSEVRDTRGDSIDDGDPYLSAIGKSRGSSITPSRGCNPFWPRPIR